MLPVLLLFVLLAPYFCMYAIRPTHNFWIFAGAHIGLCAWPLFLPVIWTPAATILEELPGAPLSAMLIGIPHQQIAPLRICWFIFLVFAALRSITVRLKGRHGYDVGYLVFCIALLTALTLISGSFGMRGVTALNAVWAFTIITGYLVYNQTVRIDESLAILSASGRKPVMAILRFNNSILAIFLIPVIMFAIISPWLPLDRATGLLGVMLLAGLRALFRFFSWIMAMFDSGEPEEIPEDPPPQEQDLGGFMGDANEQPAWLALIEMIINVLLQLALVAFIAALIAYAAYKLYKRFLATRSSGGEDALGGDTSEYIGPKLAAKPIAEALGNLLRRLSPKSEAERVRRLYYKKVRRHIKKGAAVRQTDTTGEIAATLRPIENIDGLTSQYERARYWEL